MADSYKVSVRVASQKGTCEAGHKVNDQWVIDTKTPEGICLQAFNAMYPIARVLMFGGTFPWQTDPDTVKSACPDPDNPVVFELRRLRK